MTHVIERNGHLFGVFPPGWPLVIAGAMLLQIPAWLLNPLLSAGLFVLTFRLAARVTEDQATAALTSLTLVAWHRGAEVLIAHLGELALWTPPMLLAAYITAMRKTPLTSRLAAVGAGAACVMIGLYPYINRGGNQYGPRFYFDGFPLLVVAAAAIVFGAIRYEDRSRRSRRLVYLFFASLLVHVPIAAIEMRASHAQVVERLDLARQVERAGLNNAIVFVLTPIGVERPLPATDLTRNGIALDGPVLYALDRGPENVELERYYPGRACYSYAYDPQTRSGSLAPCARRQ